MDSEEEFGLNDVDVTPVYYQADWVPVMADQKGVPKGLQYLTDIQMVLLEKLDNPDLDNCFESENFVFPFEVASVFKVLNKFGKIIYILVEETHNCQDGCCRRYRPTTSFLLNREGDEVCRFIRSFRLLPGCYALMCCPCCKEKVTVWHSDAGQPPLGFIRDCCHPCRYAYNILGPNKNVKYWLSSNYFPYCRKIPKFNVKTIGTHARGIGNISQSVTKPKASESASKQTENTVRIATDLPSGATPEIKSLFLAAAMLLNTIYFDV